MTMYYHIDYLLGGKHKMHSIFIASCRPLKLNNFAKISTLATKVNMRNIHVLHGYLCQVLWGTIGQHGFDCMLIATIVEVITRKVFDEKALCHISICEAEHTWIPYKIFFLIFDTALHPYFSAGGQWGKGDSLWSDIVLTSPDHVSQLPITIKDLGQVHWWKS